MGNQYDGLEKLMRAANPVPKPTTTALPTKYRSLRDQILAPRQSPARPPVGSRRPVWIGIFAGLAAITALALFSVVVLPSHDGAVAQTPAPLAFTAGDPSVAHAVASAQQALRENIGPSNPIRGAEWVGWYLKNDHADRGLASAVISPENTIVRWASDLSGSILVTAAASFWADGGPEAVPPSRAKPAGTIVSEMVFDAGGFPTPTENAPGPTSEEMLEMLHQYGFAQNSKSGYELVAAIITVFEYWTLTNEQHAQLLQLLVGLNDLTVLGTGTDRASRAIVGIAATTANGEAQTIVLVSTRTGRIVGAESLRLKADSAIPAGSVVSYRMWEVTQ